MRRNLKYFIGIYFLIFLSGCSLPAGFSAASWAIDGASYLATKKSLTDHGISFVAGQDCALYRLITATNVCHHYDDLTFSILRMVDVSELMEHHISRDNLNEIYYGFELFMHDKNITVNDTLRFSQDNEFIAKKYGD